MSRFTLADLLDVAVYIGVLTVFTTFFPQVISESFAITVLTGLLLKAVLEVVLVVKKRAVARFRAASTTLKRIGSAALLVLILPGSKFVVIEATAFVFGDAVRLGGFFLVTALVFALMLARAGVRRAFEAVARRGPEA